MPRRRILKRAPVVYILMQLRFAPILAMAKYVPDIQDALRRSGLPLMVPRPRPMPRWLASATSSRHGSPAGPRRSA